MFIILILRISSVATPWVFSQDLGVLIRPWDMGLSHENLEIFTGILKYDWTIFFPDFSSGSFDLNHHRAWRTG